MLTFAEWLVNTRLEKDYTLAVMSERTGLSKTTVFMVEAGKVSPRLVTAEKLCKALGTTLWAALKVSEESRKRR